MSEGRPDDHGDPSVFRPENLLREARRQRGRPDAPVPALCVLDPDGDMFRAVRARGGARVAAEWACYHTEMVIAEIGGIAVGIVPHAVGAPFAVLVAEQLFSSGCRLLVSITSAGRIAKGGPDGAYFILIDAALRDEGTSRLYAAAHDGSSLADAGLVSRAADRLAHLDVVRGLTWTTDAPYRETEAAIDWARRRGALAVEMEAAALYAFAAARGAAVLCLAHVTNRMAQSEGDFEKGVADGADDALAVVAALASLA